MLYFVRINSILFNLLCVYKETFMCLARGEATHREAHFAALFGPLRQGPSRLFLGRLLLGHHLVLLGEQGAGDDQLGLFLAAGGLAGRLGRLLHALAGACTGTSRATGGRARLAFIIHTEHKVLEIDGTLYKQCTQQHTAEGWGLAGEWRNSTNHAFPYCWSMLLAEFM